jgi:hypothetical protein
MVLSSVEPLTQVVDPFISSINPTPPLKSAKVVDPVPSSIDPTPPLKSANKVVDLVFPLVDPTPHSKNEDLSQVYLVNVDSHG